jgi:ribosomal protein S18 acetylase RimI-like enzyme
MSVRKLHESGPVGRRERPGVAAPVAIRVATPRDARRVADMANDLALLTTGQRGRMTADDVARDLIGDPALGCHVADRGGLAVGYMLWSAAYETAFAARGIYLSDLYVMAGHRGEGVAREMMRTLARLCEEDGGRFIWWVVTPGNADAQAFYDGLGATRDPVDARAVFEAPFRELLNP